MVSVGIFYENPFRAGGTETWILNICKVYKDGYDITIYYPDTLQLGKNVAKGAYDRLAYMVKLRPVSTEEIKCDVAIFAFDYFHLDQVVADKKYLFIHPGNGHGSHPRTPKAYSMFDKVIGVSQYTVDKMAKWCPGLEVERVYNPVPEQELRFISMSRAAKDKGWSRMIGLARAMEKRGIKFRWDVYTDYVGVVECPYMHFCEPTIHAEDKIRESDFLVQLSDYESFGYSLVEGMQFSKLIVTDIEILPEMGITKDNAVIVPMKNIDYNAVIDDILSRTYRPPYTDYAVILGQPDEKASKTVKKVFNVSNGDVYIEDQDLWIEEDKIAFVDLTDSVSKQLELKTLREIK